jgi:hypothetical protein
VSTRWRCSDIHEFGKGRTEIEWMNERRKPHTHTNNNNKMKPKLSWTFLPRKKGPLSSKVRKSNRAFALFQNRWSLYSYCMDDGFIVDPRESEESTHCKVLLWNSFTLWNGSLVYPYSIILNDVCPHGHLHFLTSLQLASFCYLSPKNFGLEVFTIALLSTSNCIYIYIYIYIVLTPIEA